MTLLRAMVRVLQNSTALIRAHEYPWANNRMIWVRRRIRGSRLCRYCVAIDPGASVPGYVISNWAVLQLPRVLAVNLGRNAKFITTSLILLPFVRTGMTDEYAENSKVFSRWQPRMLETHEAAEAFMQLLARPRDELNQGMFELLVEGSAEEVRVTWKKVHLDLREEPLDWSETNALRF